MARVQIQTVSAIDISSILARTKYADDETAEETMQTYLDRSIAVLAGKHEGEVMCIWGLMAPTLLSDPYLWLLTTDVADQHQFMFIRQSQRYLEELLQEYPRIIGRVEVDNKRGQRWLKWLGATFGEAQGKTMPFVIRSKHG